MLTLIKEMISTTALDWWLWLANPGAGRSEGQARRRRWVRNLWIVTLAVMVALRDVPQALIGLGLIAFIATFIILDEVGRG